MQTELRARLKADSTLAGLLGNRIDWDERPQGKLLPAITLQVIFDARPRHMAGVQNTRIDLVQMDVWAATHASAKAVGDAAIAALEPAANQGSIRFFATIVDGGRSGSERTDTGTVYRRSIDLRIAYTPIP